MRYLAILALVAFLAVPVVGGCKKTEPTPPKAPETAPVTPPEAPAPAK